MMLESKSLFVLQLSSKTQLRETESMRGKVSGNR